MKQILEKIDLNLGIHVVFYTRASFQFVNYLLRTTICPDDQNQLAVKSFLFFHEVAMHK